MGKCTKGYLAQRTGQLPPVTLFIFLRRSFSSGPIVPTYKWKIIIHVPCYHQLENEVLKVKDFEVMWRSKSLHNVLERRVSIKQLLWACVLHVHMYPLTLLHGLNTRWAKTASDPWLGNGCPSRMISCWAAINSVRRAGKNRKMERKEKYLLMPRRPSLTDLRIVFYL